MGKMSGLFGVAPLQASFEDCSSLKHVQIPPLVTRIDDCAFEGTGIESVLVPRWAVLDHPFPAKTSIFISGNLGNA